jgi:hypothetical protein
MYVGLHVKRVVFLPGFNQNGKLSADFLVSPKYKIRPVRADKRTDATEVTVFFLQLFCERA